MEIKVGSLVTLRNLESGTYSSTATSEYYITESMAELSGNNVVVTEVCEDKSFKIEDFANLFFTPEMVAAIDGVEYQQPEPEPVYCSICGRLINPCSATTVNGETVCVHCYEEAEGIVGSYHSFGRSNYEVHSFGGENKFSGTLIGAELEIENTGRKNRDILAYKVKMKDTNNIIHFERDGSLDNGFEIITQPMTFKYWKDSYGNDLKEMLGVLKKNGAKSHDTITCGLHFHVGRQSLATNTRSEEEVIDNIILIVETFKKEIQKFARRKKNRYTKFLSGEESIDMDFVKDKKDNNDRYFAVNISNANTIEFRMFKGTLIFETFMASLELVNNIVNIAKYRNIDGITWNDIITYHKTTNNYLMQYNQTLNIESNAKVRLLSIYEVNKEEYSLKNLVKGDFDVALPRFDNYNLVELGGFLQILKLKKKFNFERAKPQQIIELFMNFKFLRFVDNIGTFSDYRQNHNSESVITLKKLMDLYNKYPELLKI